MGSVTAVCSRGLECGGISLETERACAIIAGLPFLLRDLREIGSGDVAACGFLLQRTLCAILLFRDWCDRWNFGVTTKERPSMGDFRWSG